jgi:hypothetical protein
VKVGNSNRDGVAPPIDSEFAPGDAPCIAIEVPTT